MPLKVSVGHQQKLGQPNYGSLGASCYVEFEADATLLEKDLAGFQKKVSQTFQACRQAVQDQLAQQATAGPPTNGQGHGSPNGNGSANGHYANGNGNGHPHGRNGHANGYAQNGHSHQNRDRPATQSQARAIRTIAGRQRVALAELLQGRFGVAAPEQLSLDDASHLIDELKGNGGRS